MKVFKTYNAARKAANGEPILQVGGKLYIVGVTPLDSVDLISGNGQYAGQVTLRHLNRLGNANHATPAPTWAMQPANWSE